MQGWCGDPNDVPGQVLSGLVVLKSTQGWFIPRLPNFILYVVAPVQGISTLQSSQFLTAKTPPP
eukprot:5345593-Amphidinium_carterae.1